MVIALCVLFIIVSCGARLTFLGFVLYYLSHLRVGSALILSSAVFAIFTLSDLLTKYPKVYELI